MMTHCIIMLLWIDVQFRGSQRYFDVEFTRGMWIQYSFLFISVLVFADSVKSPSACCAGESVHCEFIRAYLLKTAAGCCGKLSRWERNLTTTTKTPSCPSRLSTPCPPSFSISPFFCLFLSTARLVFPLSIPPPLAFLSPRHPSSCLASEVHTCVTQILRKAGRGRENKNKTADEGDD